jgi:hypothetical protein
MNQSPERQPSPEPSARACVTRRGILTGLLLVLLNVNRVLAASLRCSRP